MPKRISGSSRRPLRFPVSTLAVVAGGAALALAAGVHAAAMATRQNRPQIAIALIADEPVALSRLAALEIAERAAQGRPAPGARALARRSLTAQALNPAALRMLALTRGKTLGKDVDFRLVHLSDAVSRRDFSTQALLIQEAAEKQDVAGVLRAYDTALRTKQSSQQVLFPQLVKAMELPGMAALFAPFVRDRPDWLSPFLVYAVVSSDHPGLFSRLLRANGGAAGLDRAGEIEIGLVNRLIAVERDYSEARRYYLSTNGAKAGVLNSPAIGADSLEPASNGLLWQLFEQPGRGAEALGVAAISAYAEGGRSGPVARKVLYLDPARYRLTGRYEDIKFAEGGGATWNVSCLGKAARLLSTATATVPGTRPSVVASFDFTVPQGCPAVLLELALIGGGERDASELTVSSLRLDRAGRAGTNRP